MNSASERLFLGVDGGGTRCRARIRDGGGRLVGEGVSGPANARRGAGATMAAVVGAARAALAQGGFDDGALASLHAGLGLAGVCQRAGRDAMLAEPHPFASRALATDFVTACLGAHGGADGGVVIVGTGSVAYGQANGDEFRFGGWGFEVGDDGGGAPLGRAAIVHTLRAADGLEAGGALADEALRMLGGDQDAAVEWVGRAAPADFGGFAPLVLRHAVDDPAAARLLDAAADAVSALVLRLLGCGVTRVALVGGLAEAYAPRLSEPARATLTPPQGDALEGALELARSGSGGAA